ncbi:START domain-containing protein 10-like [Halichondria panicea]|uniref:START domain-containing protein 10-like n=1 Tax=Halichondria panicea TaxID=6063 RepID=UPI00312B2FE6
MATDDDDYNPFSEEDLQKILHEEKESSREEGWKFLRKNDLCEIWWKNEEDTPVHLIKGFLSFPGIPPDKIVELLHDLERRKEWDTAFSSIDLVETHKHYRVVYWLAKMPIGVTNRDLVQHIGMRRDEAANMTYFLYKNATHEKYPAGDTGTIRAETILSGVIVRPDPSDSNSTKMSILLQTDMKGLIPHLISNAFASHAPGRWRDSLEKHCHEHYVGKN